MTRKALPFALALNFFILPMGFSVEKADETKEKATLVSKPAVSSSKFTPFTGKVTKNKVRLRLQPNYEGPIIQELNEGDLYVILSETEDFFAVKPPSQSKAYVFRTFVLDNVIEGNRVNVRLKPDLDAPVVAQLNSGDRINGTVDVSNPKWLEINMPDSTRFFVAKEYIEKVGDADYLARLEKRRQDVNHLLNTNEILVQNELQKPFNQINLESIKAAYQRILSDYSDFPDAVAKAKNTLALAQESYTHKKIAYLESQSKQAASQLENKAQELQAHKSKILTLEQQLELNRQNVSLSNYPTEFFAPAKPNTLPVNMSTWIPVEENLFANWAQQTGYSDFNYFYQEQRQNALFLQGVIDPYTRPVKNKPGDYMLINPSNKLPLAFLYSTAVNLQDYVGHQVTLRVSPRPNNHFAFPAYFVLSVD